MADIVSRNLRSRKLAESSYRHFIDQVRFRYGVELSVSDCSHIRNLLATVSGQELLQAKWLGHEAEHLGRGLREIWQVCLNSVKGFEESSVRLILVRSQDDGGLVTALPHDWVRRNLVHRGDPNHRRIRNGRGKDYRPNRSRRKINGDWESSEG